MGTDLKTSFFRHFTNALTFVGFFFIFIHDAHSRARHASLIEPKKSGRIQRLNWAELEPEVKRRNSKKTFYVTLVPIYERKGWTIDATGKGVRKLKPKKGPNKGRYVFYVPLRYPKSSITRIKLIATGPSEAQETQKLEIMYWKERKAPFKLGVSVEGSARIHDNRTTGTTASLTPKDHKAAGLSLAFLLDDKFRLDVGYVKSLASQKFNTINIGGQLYAFKVDGFLFIKNPILTNTWAFGKIEYSLVDTISPPKSASGKTKFSANDNMSKYGAGLSFRIGETPFYTSVFLVVGKLGSSTWFQTSASLGYYILNLSSKLER